MTSSGAYTVEPLATSDFDGILEICDRYSDVDVGFVDAAVLSVVERLPKLATLDMTHFRAVRPRHVDALRLLPGDGAH